jgi:hypothetical protein
MRVYPCSWYPTTDTNPFGTWSISGMTVFLSTLKTLYVFLVLSPDRRRVVHFNVATPRSPWQNGYCERVIGTIRRE